MSKVPSREELAQSGTLEELYGKLALVGIAPGWNKKVASLWPAPKKNFVPAHWKYEQARGALDAAGRLINTELAERRNLILYNPVSDASYGTVRTMVAAYQMIMPGEWARSHRHTPNALRLILEFRARHLHRSRRRQDRHGARRRAAHAELVEPRPRQ